MPRPPPLLVQQQPQTHLLLDIPIPSNSNRHVVAGDGEGLAAAATAGRLREAPLCRGKETMLMEIKITCSMRTRMVLRMTATITRRVK
mmetsp:Transcript_9510/g.17363  ORF Transcript_9510/g.17363 Transcript_9510/m.17363 type:complete len:88 (-) Transcript_9510:1579-1842(-)